MKRSLAILFAILSLSIFFSLERDPQRLCVELEVEQFAIEDVEQSFSQGDNYLDLNGRRGSSSVVSVAKLITKNAPSRRSVLDTLLGVKVAIASLYSQCSYSYSCDFPFEHFPQRELFFLLRNIRI
ncbi:MAG: hypothetical protein SNG81_06665 [Rikenellaceae bacterium]